MNLYRMLKEREAAGNPIRVGLIGAGRFGTMYLAQARRSPGMHVVAIADLSVGKIETGLASCGWEKARYAAKSFDEARKTGATCLTDDAFDVIDNAGLDIVIEATGDPRAGIRHALAAIARGCHVAMVNVEADVIAGPLLAREAEKAGVIYSLAYGDQPAIICEQVDWARASGFEIVAAGKATRYHSSFHQSTPETVWENFGITAEFAARANLNPKMFNSFIDGTKSGIEMSAVCNATGLEPQKDGLNFPSAAANDIVNVCRPEEDGGVLTRTGTTEVVSSLDARKQLIPGHVQLGTFVVVDAGHDYVRDFHREAMYVFDGTHQYMAMVRSAHWIGFEFGISIASIALRGEPTGAPIGFFADVVATAKRPLKAGEVLDGEGGFCVWGKQMPAAQSIKIGALPLGLSNDLTLKRDIAEGASVTWADVEVGEDDLAVQTRREMETAFTDRKAA